MSIPNARTPHRLSQISTMWTVLAQAPSGDNDDATAARRLLIERYGGAVRSYLRAAVEDSEAADDLSQKFALGLVRGEFRGADPRRGSFRSYVKAVLFHLVSRHRREERNRPRLLSDADAIMIPARDERKRFDRAWREELLTRAWQTLQQAHPAGYAALRLKAEGFTSDSWAVELCRRTGKLFTPAGARQLLHRARERFAAYLLDAVAHSLADPTTDNLAEELRELDLLGFCHDALRLYRM